MLMRTLVILLASVALAHAAPLPQLKVGPCPSGYAQSGDFCAPSGWAQSGAYCLEMRRR
jgi:hypothetical protein